jgi:hypothetical protein
VIGGTFDIPKIGQVPKVAVLGIGGAGAAYVAYRWWQARNGTGADGTAPTDPGFEDPGTLPGVAGAVPDDGSFGGDTGGTGGSSTGQITTNSAWSNDALAKLTGTGAYDAGAVADALGAYLSARPLTADQIRIVQAALAVSGQPPVGTFTLIPGGDTSLGVAPSGLSVTGVTTTSASVAFTGVPGAASYRAYLNGIPGPTAASSPIPLTGLSQNTSYAVKVVALTSSGKASPDSPSVSFKTTVAAVAAPTGLHTSNVGPTSFYLGWNKVPGAAGYQILINGKQVGQSILANQGPATGLKKGTKYTIGVRAINANNSVGPTATITATTKKS